MDVKISLFNDNYVEVGELVYEIDDVSRQFIKALARHPEGITENDLIAEIFSRHSTNYVPSVAEQVRLGRICEFFSGIEDEFGEDIFVAYEVGDRDPIISYEPTFALKYSHRNFVSNVIAPGQESRLEPEFIVAPKVPKGGAREIERGLDDATELESENLGTSASGLYADTNETEEGKPFVFIDEPEGELAPIFDELQRAILRVIGDANNFSGKESDRIILSQFFKKVLNVDKPSTIEEVDVTQAMIRLNRWLEENSIDLKLNRFGSPFGAYIQIDNPDLIPERIFEVEAREFQIHLEFEEGREARKEERYMAALEAHNQEIEAAKAKRVALEESAAAKQSAVAEKARLKNERREKAAEERRAAVEARRIERLELKEKRMAEIARQREINNDRSAARIAKPSVKNLVKRGRSEWAHGLHLPPVPTVREKIRIGRISRATGMTVDEITSLYDSIAKTLNGVRKLSGSEKLSVIKFIHATCENADTKNLREAAYRSLLVSFETRIKKMAKASSIGYPGFYDLNVQAGIRGLYDGIARFQERLVNANGQPGDSNIDSYLAIRIHGEIVDTIRLEASKRRNGKERFPSISLDEYLGDDSETTRGDLIEDTRQTPEEAVFATQIRNGQMLQSAMDELRELRSLRLGGVSDRDLSFTIFYFGLEELMTPSEKLDYSQLQKSNETGAPTLATLATYFGGITESRGSQIVTATCGKLRNVLDADSLVI